MSFIIFPNQLFELKYIKNIIKGKNLILIEDPIYFGKRESMLNFNKIKLIYLRATFQGYHKYLLDHKIKHKYIEYKDVNYKIIKSPFHIFDPNDNLLIKRLKNYTKDLIIYDNPNFLLPNSELDRINKLYNSKYNHTKFYSEVKKYLNILVDEKSYDQDNRKKIPKNCKMPPLPNLKSDDKILIKDATIYINKIFPKALDPFNGEIVFPTTYKSSKQWLKYFIEKKFKNFGKYQDAIMKPESESDMYLFHSTISPMLNIGLLQPKTIINETQKAYRKGDVGIETFEGFIRQIIGWREYQRLLYKYQYNKMKSSNYFQNKRKLSNKWYSAKIGVEPIDDAIKQAFKYGYLHHILRLMVVGNFMNLCRIHPDHVYKWFMEFSLDSYDWVMIQNVYGMAMWSDRGLSMRKPYLSSDSYILSMSNYNKNDSWTKVWKSLFYNFLNDNKDKLKGTPYVRNIDYLKKQMIKDPSFLSLGKKFLSNI